MPRIWDTTRPSQKKTEKRAKEAKKGICVQRAAEPNGKETQRGKRGCHKAKQKGAAASGGRSSEVPAQRGQHVRAQGVLEGVGHHALHVPGGLPVGFSILQITRKPFKDDSKNRGFGEWGGKSVFWPPNGSWPGGLGVLVRLVGAGRLGPWGPGPGLHAPAWAQGMNAFSQSSGPGSGSGPEMSCRDAGVIDLTNDPPPAWGEAGLHLRVQKHNKNGAFGAEEKAAWKKISKDELAHQCYSAREGEKRGESKLARGLLVCLQLAGRPSPPRGVRRHILKQTSGWGGRKIKTVQKKVLNLHKCELRTQENASI